LTSKNQTGAVYQGYLAFHEALHHKIVSSVLLSLAFL